MNEFKSYHPIVNFIYFLLSIGLSMFFLHPVCIGVSLVCGFMYLWVSGGGKAIKTSLMISLPMIIISGVINTAFNHAGINIIGYFPNGNAITIESIVYGFLTGGMIASVIGWFSCYNKIMTEDKFIYLFGRLSPSLALVVSMTLRFVPQYRDELKKVVNAQRCIGKDVRKGSILARIKTATEIMSIMITWSLERSVTTSDSMRARGYGLPKRTAFAIFRFKKRDLFALLYMLALGTYIIFGALGGAVAFECFPYIRMNNEISVFTAYFLLLIFPVIIEVKEGWKWKLLKRKI